MLFHFFQVRHALHTQFMDTYPTLSSIDVLEVIYRGEPRQLISLFYSMLTTPLATKLAYSIKQKWVYNVGELENEDWGEVSETPKLVSHKLSDRLIQTHIMHRA